MKQRNFSFYANSDWIFVCGFLLLTLLSITGIPVTAEPLKGQIIVDPENPGYMVYADTWVNGRLKPVFFAGPGDPEELLYFHTEKTIDSLIAKGARCVYVIAYSEDDFDGDPGSGSKFEAAMNQWDIWIGKLEKAGIITFFFFFDDAHTWRSDWQDFVGKIVAKLKEHKLLIWCIKEEYSEGASKQTVSNVAALIRSKDNRKHVVAVHQLGGWKFDFADDKNLDMFAMQIDRGSAANLHAAVVSGWNYMQGKKILNAAEPWLDGQATGDVDDDTQRKISWALAMGGASAVMHLAMGRFFHVSGYEDEMGPNTDKSYQDCAILSDFMESTDFNLMAPHDELAAGETKWVLAKPGSSYIAYSTDCQGTIGLRSLSKGDYHLVWLDIPSGKSIKENKSLGSGTIFLTVPSSIGTELALWLQLDTTDTTTSVFRGTFLNQGNSCLPFRGQVYNLLGQQQATLNLTLHPFGQFIPGSSLDYNRVLIIWKSEKGTVQARRFFLAK